MPRLYALECRDEKGLPLSANFKLKSNVWLKLTKVVAAANYLVVEMDRKKTAQPQTVEKRELLSKRVMEEDEVEEDSDSLKDWNPADAALDALPPIDEMVEVIPSVLP